MSRALLVVFALVWVGATLALSEARWFARRSLADRLRPYAPNPWRREARAGVLSVASFREVVVPLSQALGARAAALAGVHEDVAIRLARVHHPLDPAGFRVRQAGAAVGAFGAGLLVVAVARPPGALGLLALIGAPALAFLAVEQRLARASAAWQERLFHEAPVIAEQVGMLLTAGYSLGGALDRIAARSSGATARDLARVQARTRQGISQSEALREWAELAQVDAVTRLVAVLALDREAGDLGRLIAEEARATRREVQRRLLAQIERRAQQVWIPVTVATLVPGTLFLAVPFLQAMQLFAGS